MKKLIKEIYTMDEPGLNILEKCVIWNAIAEFLEIVGIDNIEKHDLKAWRHSRDYRNSDGSLMPYHSVDWYLQDSWDRGRGQFNATNIIHSFYHEPWRQVKDHHDILIMHSDIYDGSDSNNFVIGLASKGIGAVISTYRFRRLLKDDQTRFRCIETVTMHELGHVFGLLPDYREKGYHSSDGHCINDCIMQQGYGIQDWEVMTHSRWIKKELGYSPLCNMCEKDLKAVLKNEK